MRKAKRLLVAALLFDAGDGSKHWTCLRPPSWYVSRFASTGSFWLIPMAQEKHGTLGTRTRRAFAFSS